MRIARFDDGGSARVALVEGDLLLPLARGTDVRELLAMEPAERTRAVERSLTSEGSRPVSGTRLLPPIATPVIRDFFNFESHADGVFRCFGREGVPDRWYEEPVSFIQNPHTVIGPYDDVEIPPGCAEFDFELEVGAVIGQFASNIRIEDAENYIAAYTIFNDWSARDVQIAAVKAGRNETKAKDGATSLGPWLVTADELQAHLRDGVLDLELSARVNDHEIGRDRLASMSWRFPELVAFSARGSLLAPGDIIGSGTCGGGCLMELWGYAGRREPPPLQAGDVVTLSVEGIGTLESRVVDSPAEFTMIPPARRST